MAGFKHSNAMLSASAFFFAKLQPKCHGTTIASSKMNNESYAQYFLFLQK